MQIFVLGKASRSNLDRQRAAHLSFIPTPQTLIFLAIWKKIDFGDPGCSCSICLHTPLLIRGGFRRCSSVQYVSDEPRFDLELRLAQASLFDIQE